MSSLTTTLATIPPDIVRVILTFSDATSIEYLRSICEDHSGLITDYMASSPFATHLSIQFMERMREIINREVQRRATCVRTSRFGSCACDDKYHPRANTDTIFKRFVKDVAGESPDVRSWDMKTQRTFMQGCANTAVSIRHRRSPDPPNLYTSIVRWNFANKCMQTGGDPEVPNCIAAVMLPRNNALKELKRIADRNSWESDSRSIGKMCASYHIEVKSTRRTINAHRIVSEYKHPKHNGTMTTRYIIRRAALAVYGSLYGSVTDNISERLYRLLIRPHAGSLIGRWRTIRRVSSRPMVRAAVCAVEDSVPYV